MLQECIHPEDADLGTGVFAAESLGESTCSLRLRHADGRIVCVKAEYRKARAADGAGVILDLGLQDAKTLPRTLPEISTLAVVNAMLENPDEHIHFQDRNHVCVGASKALAYLSAGVASGQGALGYTDYDLYPEAYADIYYRMEKRVFAGEPMAREIQRVVEEDGSARWIENCKYPIYGEQGEIVGLYGLGRDITGQKRSEEALAESRERLELAAANNGIGIWDWNLLTGELTWDNSMFALYHVAPGEFSGTVHAWEKLLHPDDGEPMIRALHAARSGVKPLETVFRIYWPDREVRYIQAAGKLIFDKRGQARRLLGTNVDVTREHIATAQLQNSEQQLRFVLEGSQLGFWDWCIPEGKVERNERWANMLGYSYREIKETTQQWTDFIHPDDRDRAWDSIRAVLEGRSPTHKIEYRMLHKNGGIRWILDQANVMQKDALGRPIRMCGTHTDITERKALEDELRRQAHFDFLTQVCTRRYFMQQLEQEVLRIQRYGTEFSLLMLDIDRFKEINDGYGHETGDQVLKKFGETCLATVRHVDVVGRLGGEEFAVLLPQTHCAEAVDLAERLSAAVEHLGVPDGLGGVLHFTVSIGVAAARSERDDTDALLKSADQAMYAAKREGRNRVHVACG